MIFTQTELDKIASLVDSDKVIATYNCGNILPSIKKFRYAYAIYNNGDYIIWDSVRCLAPNVHHIKCDITKSEQVGYAILSMSPIDVLIMNINITTDFYAFCGLVRIGGKIILVNQYNPAWVAFVAVMNKKRPVELFDNLIIIDWR